MQPFKSTQPLSVAMETVPLYSLPIPLLDLILLALQREGEVNSELLIWGQGGSLDDADGLHHFWSKSTFDLCVFRSMPTNRQLDELA